MANPRWFIFGDSLSDDGATQGVLSGPTDAAFGGRASTGLLWHEVIRDGLLVAPGGDRLGPAPELDGTLGGALENGVNFAHSGAQTAAASGGNATGFVEQAQGMTTLLAADQIPAVTDQDLFVVVVGGNDITDDLGARGLIDADRIIDALRTGLDLLQDAGMARLLIAGVPTLGGAFLGASTVDIPFLTGLANLQIVALNARIQSLAEDYATAGIEVLYFDTAGFAQAVADDPAAYGFDDVVTDCFSDGFTQLTCPDTYFSVDGIHPTAAGHRAVAEAVIATAQSAGFDLALPPEPLIGTPLPDLLDGSAADDTLTGMAGNDTLQGGDGADLARGGTGFDQILGGDGPDTLQGNDGYDTLLGGNGDDLLLGNNGFDSLIGGAGNDTGLGGLGPDTLLGDAGEDLLSGQAGSDVLLGGTGSDTLNGNAGADALSGEDGADLLHGGINNDTLTGGAGDDSLNGNSGADSLQGGIGDDTLNGNAGPDRLAGGIGNDLLLGGIDRDVFVFGAGDGADTIADFQPGFDEVALDQSLFGSSAPTLSELSDYAQTSPGGDLLLVFGPDSLTFTGLTDVAQITDTLLFA